MDLTRRVQGSGGCPSGGSPGTRVMASASWSGNPTGARISGSHAVTTAPTHGSGTSPAPGGRGKLYPRGPGTASSPPVLAPPPAASFSSPCPWSPASPSPPSPSSPQAGGGQRAGRTARPTAPRIRPRGRNTQPGPGIRAARATGRHEVGRTQATEQERGRVRRRPCLAARCAMELGGPGAPPLPLLGASLLPGKFRGAGGVRFRPFQGGPGSPEPEGGELPSGGCAQRGSRGGSLTSRRRGCPAAPAEQGKNGVNLPECGDRGLGGVGAAI